MGGNRGETKHWIWFDNANQRQKLFVENNCVLYMGLSKERI